MNISKIEKLSSKIVFAAAVIGLTPFAGAKHGSPTNDPPGDVCGDTSPINTPPVGGDVLGGRALPLTTGGQFLSTPTPTTYTFLTNWHARGAWTDWQKISFPAGFRFPVGTNFIHEITLMSYGEIRSSLRPLTANSQQLTATLAEIPEPLSLKPGVSSVAYGLTASNSLLFAWHDAFANREPTNRVNATIELFTSGACIVRLDTVETPIPAPLPPDIVGEGQNEDWVRANFGENADYILAMGYENWLANEWVGVNVQNGHYQTAVTIAALPTDGSPCYLSCGPYKVNVKTPGTYRFPLEVFETYETRTYPEAIALSLTHDDGHTGEGRSFEIVDAVSSPRQEEDGSSSSDAEGTPRPRRVTSQINFPLLTFYRYYMQPLVIVTPDRIPLSSANGSRISIWCNLARATFRYVSQELYLAWFGSEAEIHDAIVAEMVDVIMQMDRYECWGELYIYDEPHGDTPQDPDVPEREDATVFEGDALHTGVTNDCAVTYLTAVTVDGSTAAGEAVTSVGLVDYPAADVYVYLATTESGNDEYDDSVSWTVTANGTPVLQGQTSVSGHVGTSGCSTYGIATGAVLLATGHYIAPSDDILRLRCQCSARNVSDGLRQTCIQIVVVPIE